MKPTFLIYGNCQAGALSVIFGSDPVVTAAYDVVYMASFDDRNPDHAALTPATIAAAAVLLEQYDPNPFPHRALLPQHCTTVTYPSMDLNLLWPVQCVNVYNDRPTPESPWGPFPYGDGVIVDCVKRGMSVDETLAYYRASFADHLLDLDRFEKLERARLFSRDQKCDVRMGDFTIERFRDENLFWTINHPTMTPLRELAVRLIAALRARSSALPEIAIDSTIAALPPQGPLGEYRVPVHPQVARQLGLRWYPDASSSVYGPRTAQLTYDAYLAEMTRCAVAVRDANAVGNSA